MEQVKGYLEVTDRGFGFLRAIEHNFVPNPEDVYVHQGLINEYRLPEGGLIQGDAVPGDARSGNLKLTSVDTINSVPWETFISYARLQERISINPLEKLVITQDDDDLTGRAIDMIAPVGKGQRGLIIAPPKAGKTTILRHMANSISMNHPDVDIFVLLVDERPEEVTDFKRGLKDAHVLFSSADQDIAQHMRMTRLAMHTAILCTESGRDAVVFIDSLTRMSRAFNSHTDSHGRTMTGGLGANALQIPRKIFGAARNVEDGGSLSIFATILVETGSRMDDIIFQEFKGTGNTDLVLSRKCAEQRIWPAINVNASGTRKEELLMDAEKHREIIKIRRGLAHLNETQAMAALLDYFQEDM
ncbi:MAG: transcription termination factor Rho [Deltaproteobacteria bacterium]|nr:transcription termination factor Rho [Deltaproteobacteria bacterium]